MFEVAALRSAPMPHRLTLACKRCITRVPENARYCPHCGAVIVIPREESIPPRRRSSKKIARVRVTKRPPRT